MAESVCVGVRVRPFNDREKKLNAVVCIEMTGPTTIIRDDSDKATPFTFDESFWSHDGFQDDGSGYNEAAPGSNYADQRYVFETFGKRVLDNAWAGFHCCLFAYGQTGAGKSYSMVGYGKNKGIVPISCEEIFKRIDNNDDQSLRYEVTVSMIEIYNEAVQDLLILPEDRPKKGLEIRESKLLGIYIDGVVKRPVKDYPEIEATIEEATNHRTVGSTLMNATSSRAHTVQIIEFKQCINMGGKEQVKISMINLVDLAGSEKAGQTGASGDRLKEGAAINKSLSALGNVIEKLAEKSGGKGKNVIIPYRDSKLTRLLQNALGGSSKTIMICALSPASSNYEETLSTLRYADRAKKIKNTATVNENPQDRLLRELKEENMKLKEMMEQMQKGMVDQQALAAMAEKQQEIQDVEKELKEMQKSFDQRVAEAKERETEQRERKRRTTLGLVKSGIAVPQLVNLNEDPQLTGRIKYSLEPGVVTTIRGQKPPEDASSSSSSDGDSDSSDGSSHSQGSKGNSREIMLLNDTVFLKHATIYNDEGVCYLWAPPQNSNATFLNGVSFTVLQKEAQSPATKDDPKPTLATFLRGAVHLLKKQAESPTQPKDNAEPEEKAEPQEKTGEPNETQEKQDLQERSETAATEEKPDTQEKPEARSSLGSSCQLDTPVTATDEESPKPDSPKESPKPDSPKDEDESSSDSSSSSSDSKANSSPKSPTKDKNDEREIIHQKHRTEGIQLKHGDRVVFGKCFFFFVAPGEGIAEVMIMSGVVDFQMASKEMKKMRMKNAAFKIATGGAKLARQRTMDSCTDWSAAPSVMSVATRTSVSTTRFGADAGASPSPEGDEDELPSRMSQPMNEFDIAFHEDFDRLSSQSESELHETVLKLKAQLVQSTEALAEKENRVRLQAEEIEELRTMLERVGVPEVAQPPRKTAGPHGNTAPDSQMPRDGHSPRPNTMRLLRSETSQSLPETTTSGTLSIRPSSGLSPSPIGTNGRPPGNLKQDGFSQHVNDTFKNALGSLEKVELALIGLTTGAKAPRFLPPKKKRLRSVCYSAEVEELEPEAEAIDV